MKNRDAWSLLLFALVVAVLIIGGVSLFGCSTARAASALNSPEYFERASKSYVGIVAYGPKLFADVRYTSQGSGTVLYSDQKYSLILTCAHVIQFHANKLTTAEDIFIALDDDYEILVEAKVERVDTARDLALLRAGPIPRLAAPLAPQEPPRWSDLYMLGNARGEGLVATKGILCRRDFHTEGSGKRFLQMTGSIIYGMSGGPVFDEQGRYVGTMSNLMTWKACGDGVCVIMPVFSFALAIPLEDTRAFLKGIHL